MPIFIDRRTRASRPAQVPVRWSSYFRHRPIGLLIWFVAWVVCSSLTFLGQGNGWAISAITLAVLLWYQLYTIQVVFTEGMLCPARVLSSEPLVVGVLTDLASTPGTSRPVLKVFAPSDFSLALEPGASLAAVLTYSGVTPAGHWNDCQPQLAIVANDDPEVEKQLHARIGQDEWEGLTRACELIGSPPKCGLYTLRPKLAGLR